MTQKLKDLKRFSKKLFGVENGKVFKTFDIQFPLKVHEILIKRNGTFKLTPTFWRSPTPSWRSKETK
jgi:hypothetical protein